MGEIQPRLNSCYYKGVRRLTHPAVCEWHAEKNDPECRRVKCQVFDRLIGKEREK